jgi:hypothetical protein
MTCEYREYFRSEHPRLLAERIGEIFDHERSMLVPGFQNSLKEIYRECEERVRVNFNNRQQSRSHENNLPLETIIAPRNSGLQGAVTPQSFSPDADTPEAASTPQAEPSSINPETNKDPYEYDFAASHLMTGDEPQ